jgi:hypothetical protein
MYHAPYSPVENPYHPDFAAFPHWERRDQVDPDAPVDCRLLVDVQLLTPPVEPLEEPGPTEQDRAWWAEHSPKEGGCEPDELSPEEQDRELYTWSVVRDWLLDSRDSRFDHRDPPRPGGLVGHGFGPDFDLY